METSVMTLISLEAGFPLIRKISKNEPSKKHIEMLIGQLIKELDLKGDLIQKEFNQSGKLKVYKYNVGKFEAVAIVERADIIEYPKL